MCRGYGGPFIIEHLALLVNTRWALGEIDLKHDDLDLVVEFEAGFGFGHLDDIGQLFNALHGVGLGGQLGVVGHLGRGLVMLGVQKIIASHELDAEGVVVAGLAAPLL